MAMKRITKAKASPGIKLTIQNIFAFWHQVCVPVHQAANAPATDRDVLLNLVIQPSGPVQVVVKRHPFKIEIFPA
jgi:hypothetical protein